MNASKQFNFNNLAGTIDFGKGIVRLKTRHMLKDGAIIRIASLQP
jgi:hypothetical protein